jgi:hypothetical protein
MKLLLHYRGPLMSNGSPSHKHSIRRAFHEQLRTLWGQRPLIEMKRLLEPRKPGGDYCLLRDVPPFVFVPLVSEEMNAVAELSILLMRPEPPGGLITTGGDMDNRLKTLFDALTVPRPKRSPSWRPECRRGSPFFLPVGG